MKVLRDSTERKQVEAARIRLAAEMQMVRRLRDAVCADLSHDDWRALRATG